MGRSALPIVLVVLGLVSVPSPADASNERHIRTPVIWNGGGGECRAPELTTPCGTLHDRSQGASLHLPYVIPFEDTNVTTDEVADSRTHQFFAFCRPHHPADPLPVWISPNDVDAAAAVGLVPAGSVPPEDVLDTSSSWDGCFFRINADDERRPITCEMADAGVDWDTSGLQAGVYSLEGFTHEPPMGLWVRRPGFVKVHDGDPDDVGPAAAITTGELVPYRNDTVMIEGCVDAMEDSTFTVYWAIDGGGEIEWVEELVDLPVTGDVLSFEFDPPDALISQTGMLRVDVSDPMGRSYTAYMTSTIQVIDLDNPMTCAEGGGFIGGEHCVDGSSSAGETTSGEGSSSAGASNETTATDEGETSGSMLSGGEDSPNQGCGCAGDRGRATPLVLVGLALLRRRRAKIDSHAQAVQSPA